jgi:hypothetical protein
MTAFAFPFRFHHGKIVTVEDNSDEFAAQRIMSAIKTEIEELPLNPTFGISSPEFDHFDESGFLLTIGSNYNDIEINEITQTINQDQTTNISVKFTRIDN